MEISENTVRFIRILTMKLKLKDFSLTLVQFKALKGESTNVFTWSSVFVKCTEVLYFNHNCIGQCLLYSDFPELHTLSFKAPLQWPQTFLEI